MRLAQTPTSPGSTPSTASGRELGTGFEPAQVNDLQLQYDKEGFRITSRAPSTDSMDGVIDGRFSSSFTEPLEAGYIAVEVRWDGVLDTYICILLYAILDCVCTFTESIGLCLLSILKSY